MAGHRRTGLYLYLALSSFLLEVAVSDDRLAMALAECQENEVLALIKEQVESGASAEDIIAECNRGMTILGNRFAAGECFIPQLIVASSIMKRALEQFGQRAPRASLGVGKVVVGSVKNDVHDIGKQILAMMLRGVGFDVVDLGVNVAPQRFVAAIREHSPQVVGLSVLLTTCFASVMETTRAIEESGLRQSVAIMVGGAAASDLLASHAGCDYYGKTAVDGMRYAGKVAGVAF